MTIALKDCWCGHAWYQHLEGKGSCDAVCGGCSCPDYHPDEWEAPRAD